MAKIPSGSANDKGSLLSSDAMGGINAGKGFDFQTRYTVCHLPTWLQDGSFHQLFTEGTGDIDIRYLENGKSRRKHIQTKDHDVAPAEFKELIGAFRKFDADMPDTYQEFRLACPSLSQQMRPVETGLARFRNAKPFYDDEPSALAQTQHDVDERMRNVGLGDEDIAFIHDKVYIDVGYGDLAHDDRALDIFIGRMLGHPEFANKIRAMVLPAYAALSSKIGASKGVVLDKSSLETLLRSAVLADLSQEASVTLWVHNWTKEAFSPSADYELDWSQHFDRGSRKVQSPDAWTNDLVPQLDALRKQIMAAARCARYGCAENVPFPPASPSAQHSPQSVAGRSKFRSRRQRITGARTQRRRPVTLCRRKLRKPTQTAPTSFLA